MQQRYSWMRPALQTSEAVLLPAMQKRRFAEPAFSDRYTRQKVAEDPFRPVLQEGAGASLALSTYVRPRGSVAGRSVLRAAGIMGAPMTHGKPQYYQRRGKTMPLRERSRRW